MSKYIPGHEILELFKIRAFELFEYVRKGLQPYSDTGKPIPPPYVRQKRLLLKKLQGVVEEYEKRGSYVSKCLNELKEKGKENIPPHMIADISSFTFPDSPEHREWVRRNIPEKKKELDKLKKELDAVKDDSWVNYILPDSEIERKKVLNELVDSLYLKEEVLKIKRPIKGPPQKTVTRAPEPTKDIGGKEVPYSPVERLTPEDVKKLPKKPPELPRRINGNDLMKRWTKRDFEIIAYVKEGLLNVYYHSGELIPKDSPYPLIINEYSIFDLSEVEEFERKHPELLKQKVATRSAEQEKAIFPCMPDTKWEDIAITLTADNMVRIKTPQSEGLFTYHDLKMKDKRKGDQPTMLWELLKLFAKDNGFISSQNPKYDPKLPETAKRLNHHLKKFFGIDESIYTGHYKKEKGYRTRIKFYDRTF